MNTTPLLDFILISKHCFFLFCFNYFQNTTPHHIANNASILFVWLTRFIIQYIKYILMQDWLTNKIHFEWQSLSCQLASVDICFLLPSNQLCELLYIMMFGPGEWQTLGFHSMPTLLIQKTKIICQLARGKYCGIQFSIKEKLYANLLVTINKYKFGSHANYIKNIFLLSSNISILDK